MLNADGTWTYTLDDTNGTVQALSAGETMTDSFVAVSFDGTASATVTITITGTNDVPVISGEATGDRSVTEESDLAASGTLTIADVDDGESEFAADADTTSYGSYTLATDGSWTYTLDNANGTVQALSAGETMTDSFVAVSEDGTASATVTITITGTNDVPVISGEATGDRDVQEDVDASASGTLTIADVDDGERVHGAAGGQRDVRQLRAQCGRDVDVHAGRHERDGAGALGGRDDDGFVRGGVGGRHGQCDGDDHDHGHERRAGDHGRGHG
ncbi:MAG: hypothetical protein IPM13_16980 [Phycisphaerales bacterium]|nr:hypothetical protein [Phycisphaerales bacterium]